MHAFGDEIMHEFPPWLLKGARAQRPPLWSTSLGIVGNHFALNHFAISCFSCLTVSMKVRERKMKRTLTVTTHAEQAARDRAYWRSRTCEERLNAVEDLRLEAGKFLYEYPTRFRRVVTVTRKAQR